MQPLVRKVEMSQIMVSGIAPPTRMICPLLHQHLELRGFVTLTCCEDQRHRLAFPFHTQMQFRAETTLTFASRFLILLLLHVDGRK